MALLLLAPERLGRPEPGHLHGGPQTREQCRQHGEHHWLNDGLTGQAGIHDRADAVGAECRGEDAEIIGRSLYSSFAQATPK